MDIAQLSYSVDSSGLAVAERALDSQAKAADRVSEAAENLENRYQAIAKRGMEYAERMRQGNVSERAQAEAAREAALGIDTKARVMQNAGTQAERMARRVEAIRAAEEREARVAAESARQKALQDLNLRKLLGSIDPTIAKLERLGQLEGNLERALDVGAISPEIFDQYQAKIDATRAATLNMGKAQDIATASIGKLNLNTVEAQQSVASLARAMASGQWGMATSSLTSLTARTGAMGAAFSAAGLALGGLVAGLGLFIVQAVRGYAESRRMEGVMIGMGDATGAAAGEMLALRNEIGRATGDFKGATEAINQLVLSGKVAGDTLESVAKAATNMARLTGQSVGTVIGEIQALADDGSEALIKLNDKYNFLTISTWENIEAIRAQDGELAALAETAKELERVSADRTAKMAEQAGNLERAWSAVTREFKNAMRAMGDWGRDDLQVQLERAERNLMLARAGGTTGIANPAEVARRQAIVDSLKEQVRVQKLVNDGLNAEQEWHNRSIEAQGKLRREREQAQKAAESEIERQLQSLYGLDTAVNRLERSFLSLSEEQQRAMQADGSYAQLLNRAMEEDARRNAQRAKSSRAAIERKSEEERAVERLLSQFQRQEASMERQIALYGDTSRAAAMAYDIQASGLRGVNAELADVLEEQAKWLDFLDDMAALEDVWEQVAREAAKYGEQLDEMSQYSLQAARNMQSHFADFLFDPFSKGVRGMLEGFSDALRRMAAEAAAADLFERIGSWASGYSGRGSGWINAIGEMFGGGRYHGGDVRSDRFYRTGERNMPEILHTPAGQFLIPGDRGRVEPVASTQPSGGSIVNQKIYVQGTTDSRTARQIAIRSSQRQRLASARFGG